MASPGRSSGTSSGCPGQSLAPRSDTIQKHKDGSFSLSPSLSLSLSRQLCLAVIQTSPGISSGQQLEHQEPRKKSKTAIRNDKGQPSLGGRTWQWRHGNSCRGGAKTRTKSSETFAVRATATRGGLGSWAIQLSFLPRTASSTNAVDVVLRMLPATDLARSLTWLLHVGRSIVVHYDLNLEPVLNCRASSKLPPITQVSLCPKKKQPPHVATSYIQVPGIFDV